MKYKRGLLVIAAATVIGVSSVAEAKNVRVGAVSYTHLTLPTILLV